MHIAQCIVKSTNLKYRETSHRRLVLNTFKSENTFKEKFVGSGVNADDRVQLWACLKLFANYHEKGENSCMFAGVHTGKHLKTAFSLRYSKISSDFDVLQNIYRNVF